MPHLVALTAAAAAALAGCGGDREPAAVEAAAQKGYPSLASVPPRPAELGYSVAQGRTVAGELVRDRENAAYLGATLDYETGRTDVPPPPAPPAAAAAPRTAPAAPPAAGKERRRGPGDSPAVEAYVKDAMARDADDGELQDFLRKLERPGPAPAGRSSAAAAFGLESPPAAPAEAGPGPQRSSALQRFGGYLGGVLGVERAGRPADPGAASPLASVAFAAGSHALPAGADAGLARALGLARARKARLRIAGGGAEGALPVDRTRAVALALMRLGATPDLLELAPGGGGGEEVGVSLLPPAPPQA
jgi:hypothetical protein